MKKRVLALAMAAVMSLSLAACGGGGSPEPAAQGGTNATAAAAETKEEGNFVFATATFGQKFSPFFYTTTYDGDVVKMTSAYLLASDRGGAIIQKGIEGETRAYNGTDYTYYGIGDVEIVQNDDGSVDYNLTMRDDVKFSDGQTADIDDVIFGIYVLSDPTYDGQSTIYALPITGMEDYRSGMTARYQMLLEAGPDAYAETDAYTEDQFNTFWTAFNAGGEKFAQEIVDYCIANGYNEEGDSVAACAANWGYELAEDATAADFFAKMVETYGYDVSDEGINAETAGTPIMDFVFGEMDEETASFLQAGVQTGEGAANIAGIIRTGDYSMNALCITTVMNPFMIMRTTPSASPRVT